MIGDPLATPYATRPVVTIDPNGTEPHNRALTVHASHAAGIASIDLFERGKRVASATTDTLTFVPTEPVGATLDLLAVAVAIDAPVTRTGWTRANVQPRAQVQGWSSLSVTLGSDESEGRRRGCGFIRWAFIVELFV